MTHRLFVYGTLAPGRSNAHVLADVPGRWEPASVAGHLIEGGWAAALGYPGIVLDENGGEVPGLLFSSEHLPAHWGRLDAFEMRHVEKAKVGHIVSSLQQSRRNHALVVQHDADGQSEIRGIFSLSQIARQLGVPLQLPEAAGSFAEIEAALA